MGGRGTTECRLLQEGTLLLQRTPQWDTRRVLPDFSFLRKAGCPGFCGKMPGF